MKTTTTTALIETLENGRILPGTEVIYKVRCGRVWFDIRDDRNGTTHIPGYGWVRYAGWAYDTARVMAALGEE